MDSSVKLFLIFCFAVVFFTGCNRNDQKAAVNGPKDAQTSNQKVKKAKPVPAEVATDIANTLQILTEMSGVYNQIYQLVTDTGTTQPPQNVFQVLMKNIYVDYGVDGQRKDQPLKPPVCKEGTPHLNSTEMPAGSKHYVHELYYNRCTDNNQGEKLAKWNMNSSGNYEFTFEISSLLNPPNVAYGVYGATWRNLQQVSRCTVTYDPNKKVIAAMICEKLTHDFKYPNEVSPTHYVRFDKIDYNRTRVGSDGQPEPLSVEGAIVDLADPSKPQNFKGKDAPRLNQFHMEIYKAQDPTTDPAAKNPTTPDATGNGDSQGLAPQNSNGNQPADPNAPAATDQQGQTSQSNAQGQSTTGDGGQPPRASDANDMQSDTTQSGDSRDQQPQNPQAALSAQQKNMPRPRSLSQAAPLGSTTQGQDGSQQEQPQVRP